ncbi:MAG: OB-fold nucleic acid binding domain-containing protein [Acidilobaceae archaeon]
MSRTSGFIKVSDLKEGLEGLTLRVRVLEVYDKKVVETKRGPRTLSEALVGDETGRVKLTLWGKLAGSLKAGEVIEISNCWTTSYKGEVQVNAGSLSSIKRIEEKELPNVEEIPEDRPRTSTKGSEFRAERKSNPKNREGRRAGRGRIQRF